MKYQFSNLIGNFIIDDKPKIVGKLNKTDQKLKEPKKELLLDILSLFKDKKYYQEFYQKNLQLTKQALKESVNEDNLIIQTISNINELDKAYNLLTKRLREWYSLYFPELSEKITAHQKFVELVLSQSKKTKESMGANLAKKDLDEILLLAKQINELSILRKNHEEYLKKIMQKYCPNLLELAGTTIGARLLELGKSLKRLAMLPASTIQLLGAEKALFRHLKTGAKSPKFGVIHDHQLIQTVKPKLRGKAARMLADKLSLCARLDYFKGEFKAKEYQKVLEEKLK